MLTPQTQPPIPLTQEFYAHLQSEFQRLTDERAEVMKRLQTAREMGDLSENGAYKYAKFELGNIGRQLGQLKFLLDHGKVITKPDRPQQVAFGCTVDVMANEKTVSYLIVSQYESDPKKNKLSMESPIGQALLHRKVGETVVVDIPSGQKTFLIQAIH